MKALHQEKSESVKQKFIWWLKCRIKFDTKGAILTLSRHLNARNRCDIAKCVASKQLHSRIVRPTKAKCKDEGEKVDTEAESNNTITGESVHSASKQIRCHHKLVSVHTVILMKDKANTKDWWRETGFYLLLCTDLYWPNGRGTQCSSILTKWMPSSWPEILPSKRGQHSVMITAKPMGKRDSFHSHLLWATDDPNKPKLYFSNKATASRRLTVYLEWWRWISREQL